MKTRDGRGPGYLLFKIFIICMIALFAFSYCSAYFAAG